MWLGQLPQELYDQWIAAKDDPSGLQDVLTHLTFVNRFVLCEIMSLLSYVEKQKETTKMNASNLAIVMTPNLLYKKKTAGFSSEPQEVVETLILNYSTIFQETEAFRDRQRTERVSARHNRRLRSQATSKSLADRGSVKERRIAPTALALKAEFKLAAPQDIGPPPPPVDIPPPPVATESSERGTTSSAPDIGPPADIPPPLMAPASPVRAPDVGVLPGFSQSLIPPPPALSPPLVEDIPPPPLVGANPVVVNTVLLGDPGKSESGSSGSKKHSRHKASGSTSGSVSLDGEKKKKKKHHKNKSSSDKSEKVRSRGESVASATETNHDYGEDEGARVRAVSEWSDTRSLDSHQTNAEKSISSTATPGESVVGSDNVSQTSDAQSMESFDTPRDNDDADSTGPPAP